VGAGDRVAAALAAIADALPRPLATLERVRVCKRDGLALADPGGVPQTDTSGLPLWQKLVVHCGEQSRHAGRPLATELVLRAQAAGAAGATVLRGIRGFHGDHRPHGERLLVLRRDVPVLCVLVDTPQNVRRWFGVVDEVTAEAGLVTSEIVPAMRAGREGALGLAGPHPRAR
jgi:PII-like signaling protein